MAVGHFESEVVILHVAADAWVRLRDAADQGYLKNAEQRRGQPGKWVITEPMPDELEVLPAPESFDGGCAVAPAPGGDTPPPSLETGVDAVVNWIAECAS